ncbi:hypothetical protein TCAL_00869 [Tigriopus californicus]|uniref:E3 UFM1-protein ligase 1 homolog n=1 Tax=Tigriopus californicus TaxID=6832 RepID=A0A553NB66_TIGCA|nr:E3 UFM1-protein ligase 1-like [Tigriopus californicus]TRY62655.1 hypothetical protein TCAL_00869 [Tigriopus californicus]|eukprot:TCALIF_00869-PA protein Name:"Similar to UFL1 E3 UFM1-protein ligase 1 (Macaca fascicularis)" AED:0.03 eAED:0.03 QI:204/1/1/1/0.66/0.75/4/44/795
MSNDWDEIRRLASDLQRAQLSGSIQRLSERNCIEIVTRLTHLGLVDVVYTTDGKEYLTPQQLHREIRDELYMARGRVSLVDLAHTLNVDFSHVEGQAQIISKQDQKVHLILGQLVDSNYMDALAEQVNEKLQLEGTMNVSTMAKEYDLPGDFIQEQIATRLGSIIEGFTDEQDPKVILTPSYVQRNKAKIRGVLSAITVPTPVASIINSYKIQEQIFFSLAEELIQNQRIFGSIVGGKRAAKATFNPQSYAKAQTRWVDDFLTQNGYLEFDALSRLGISDPAAYIRKRFKDDHLTFLSSCCLSSQVVDTIDSSIDEAFVSQNWLDLSTLLPSVLSEEDGNLMLRKILDKKKHDSSHGRKSLEYQVFGQVVLFPQNILNRIETSFDEIIKEQAQNDLQNQTYAKLLNRNSGDKFEVVENDDKMDKKEERRKKATGGKGGGGTQGRETKTKSTKKKFGKGKRNDDFSDDEDDLVSKKKGTANDAKSIQLMNRGELEKKLEAMTFLHDCPEDVFTDMASFLHPRLNEKFKSLLVELYQSSQQMSVHDRKKTHNQLQENCNTNFSLLRICDKGLSHFDNEEQERKPLKKHLFKTLCTDLLNDVFAFIRDDHDINVGTGKDLNSDQRSKILSGVPKNVGEPLQELQKALSASENVEEFLEAVEEHISAASDVYIRKADKKKDRQLVFNHRQAMLDQLEETEDPALTLHLAVTLLFQIHYGTILHASGKFVPQILGHVIQFLDADDAQIMRDFEQLVLEMITLKDADKQASIKEQMLELSPKVKSVVTSYRKSSSKAAGEM